MRSPRRARQEDEAVGELASLCRLFLHETEDVAVVARTYPGGAPALVQTRTATAVLLARLNRADVSGE